MMLSFRLEVMRFTLLKLLILNSPFDDTRRMQLT
jgi:hypothetical protein